MTDPILLSRIQFAVTIGFHFIFPPISIGLAWLLVIFEWQAWRKSSAVYERLAIFFSGIFALTFVMGVATGIVMEFQFGMNWAGYSKFVGDIFGAPLAAEALSAFFLESFFLGLYLFGRKRLSKGMQWFSILVVAIGATISAFWIIAANSWQQTPAGFVLRNGRAELVDFWAAVFNASTLLRYSHTMVAAILAGALVAAGIAAYWLLHNSQHEPARKTLTIALPLALTVSVLLGFPTGDEHAKQVARLQPAKLAAMEGLFQSQKEAPLRVFGIPDLEEREVRLAVNVPISGALSILAFGDKSAEVRGLDSFPENERPPVLIPFYSFHLMVFLGGLFIGLTALAVVQLWRGKLWTQRWLLRLLVAAAPLPILGCELGWMVAEVGRQPWIVHGLLRTIDGVSPTLTAAQALTSLVAFTVVYILLLALYLFLLGYKTKRAMVDLVS